MTILNKLALVILSVYDCPLCCFVGMQLIIYMCGDEHASYMSAGNTHPWETHRLHIRITVTLTCMQPMHAGTIKPAILKWTS